MSLINRQLWMSQGYIESLEEGSNNLEDTGNSYVLNLLCRSFLELVRIDGDAGEVYKFKMHDLMHDLALKVTGNECKMIDLNESGIIRGILTSLLEATNLRTFISMKEWNKSEHNYFPNEHHEIISKFRHCRALCLGGEDFWIPPSLGSRLKHLRFLDISRNQSIQNLPYSITNLNLTTLPRDLKKLVNVRFLLIDGCGSLSHMPCGLSHLSKLQTLNLCVVQKMDHKVPGGVGSLDELGALNRFFGSIVLQNLQFLQSVSNKGHLQEKKSNVSCCLELSWSTKQQDGKIDSNELILWENLRPYSNLIILTINSCMNRSSPSYWLSSMANLIELTVDSCRERMYMPSLRELPSQRTLTLVDSYASEFVEKIIDLEFVSNEYYEIISKFRHYRAFCLGSEDFWIPPSLGSQLKHLRFIDISRNPSI
ncbi:hypothetical protein ACJRO7_032003 [Eucalyptus globulus]|uniref:Uncharacterized protein n=1 Tax=Eucalyptus globulus TaxID=34317 RepID=A0ABD3JUN6_EUCGL